MNVDSVIKRLPRLALIATVWVAIAIAILSLLPGSDLPAQKLNDKVNHFIAYGVLTFLAVLGRHSISILKIAVLAIGYGLLLEVLQGVMPFGRTASGLDAIANTGGVLIGTACGVLVGRYWLRLT